MGFTMRIVGSIVIGIVDRLGRIGKAWRLDGFPFRVHLIDFEIDAFAIPAF